ncbi:hypothetical protein JBP901_gp050 [Bacillus phage JBP901]|uniref:Uncharacterized protein n=2 Tax=Caeruleovirus TaxID=1911929 RepID=A0A0E3DER3_9CAUD|nr:hypothetical protein JBP901_gp050 [Bacillus phage JBP901]YP_009149643.1 hypothetical protein BCP8-2_082 [Bacillus phage BCP8-2]AHJ87120.1 hypothetical protein BCP8-2_082 [Bacillus phage BCP8-2]AID17763.1 hypothetical protein JBP901_gp050 [Bacillus phage JBP901]
MAIVSDYMTHGNCTVCGKYLPQGRLCCDEIVQSNYNRWWHNMMIVKKDQTPTLVLNVKKRSIGTGVKGIKDIMKESGPKYFAEIVEKNNRLREEGKAMNKEKYILRVYNEKGAMVQEHEETEKYNIMNRIYVAISDPKFVLQDMDIVKLGNVSENDSLIMYKVQGRFVR